jgi:hypothetical protein
MLNNYPPVKPLSFWKRFKPTECRTPDDWQSARQGAALRAIGNSQRIDVDAASQHLFGCNSADLNRAASRTFIGWLKAQPAQNRITDALNFCPVEECKHLQTELNGALWCGNGHSFEAAQLEEAKIA